MNKQEIKQILDIVSIHLPKSAINLVYSNMDNWRESIRGPRLLPGYPKMDEYFALLRVIDSTKATDQVNVLKCQVVSIGDIFGRDVLPVPLIELNDIIFIPDRNDYVRMDCNSNQCIAMRYHILLCYKSINKENGFDDYFEKLGVSS